MGQLVGPLVEFSVSQLFIFMDQCDSVRLRCGLLLEQFMYAEGWLVLYLSVVPLEQDLVPLVVSQQWKSRNLLVRV